MDLSGVGNAFDSIMSNSTTRQSARPDYKLYQGPGFRKVELINPASENSQRTMRMD